MLQPGTACLRVKGQESRVKAQESRGKGRESRVKSQESGEGVDFELRTSSRERLSRTISNLGLKASSTNPINLVIEGRGEWAFSPEDLEPADGSSFA